LKGFAMKKALMLCTLGWLLAAGNAQADIDEMYKEKNCFACHRIDRTTLGPGLRLIANKYADQKDADAMLAKKIREGTVGAWGQVPMPAQTQVTEEEALKLARWILALKQP
jgi:cytochrome c